jgi:spore germination protein KB
VARLTNLQLFGIVFVIMFITPYEIMAKLLAMIAGQHGWITILGSILPGLLLVWIYYYILVNSERPFPGALEQYLGKFAGKALGFIYIWAFFLVAVISLAIFANLFLSNVLPGMPISILMIFVILPAYYALRTGLETTARVIELVLFAVIPWAVIILLLGLGSETDWSRLLPLSGLPPSDFANGILLLTSYASLMVVVLTLGHFCHNTGKLWKWMLSAYAFFIVTMLVVTVVPVVVYGSYLTAIQTFPIFNVARATNIAGFIRNIEIILVSVVIPGMFSILAIFWFLTCYTAQEVFGLRNYRILLSPTAIMAGILAVLMIPNIHILFVTLHKILPWIYIAVFGFIPGILALVIRIEKHIKMVEPGSTLNTK